MLRRRFGSFAIGEDNRQSYEGVSTHARSSEPFLIAPREGSAITLALMGRLMRSSFSRSGAFLAAAFRDFALSSEATVKGKMLRFLTLRTSTVLSHSCLF